MQQGLTPLVATQDTGTLGRLWAARRHGAAVKGSSLKHISAGCERGEAQESQERAQKHLRSGYHHGGGFKRGWLGTVVRSGATSFLFCMEMWRGQQVAS